MTSRSVRPVFASLLIVGTLAVGPATGAAAADGAPPSPRDEWTEREARADAPTTTTTTAAPAEDSRTEAGRTMNPGSIAGDILIGLALEIRDFAPPAWAASEESAIRARLEATDLSRAVPGGITARDDRAPVTDVLATFARPGPSLRSQFAPAAILGAVLAWASITGFERRRRKDRPAES